jgi:hypothetical protein
LADKTAPLFNVKLLLKIFNCPALPVPVELTAVPEPLEMVVFVSQW